MKISKARLKQIIKEELGALMPADPLPLPIDLRDGYRQVRRVFVEMQRQIEFAQVIIDESTSASLPGDLDPGLRGEDIDNIKINIEEARELAAKLTGDPAYALENEDFNELDELLAEVHNDANAAIDGPGIEKLLDGLDEIEDMMMDLYDNWEEHQF